MDNHTTAWGDDREVEFTTLGPDGATISSRTLDYATLLACPHFILVPEHYREDGPCRCDDPSAAEMVEWGYTWNGKAWA